MVTKVVETVVIRHDDTATESVVFKIPATISSHNVMREVLAYVKRTHPGVWLEFLADEARARSAAYAPKAEPKAKQFEDVPM